MSSDENTNTSSKNTFNGHTFVKSGEFWGLTIGSYNFLFRNFPSESALTEKGNISTIDQYAGKPLYISSENMQASFEIYNNLNKIVERWQFACESGKNCTENLPIKDCSSNFIILEEGNNEEIEQKQGCVYIRASSENITRITDEFIYRIIGVK